MGYPVGTTGPGLWSKPILKSIQKTGRPIVLTINGNAGAVLVDAKEYEKILKTFNLLKLLISAEEDLREGRYTEAEEFFEEFKVVEGL